MSTLRDDALRTAVVPTRRRAARRRLPAPRPAALEQIGGAVATPPSAAPTPSAAPGTGSTAPRDRAPQRPSTLLDAYCVLLGAVLLAGSVVGEAVSAPLRGRRRDGRRPV